MADLTVLSSSPLPLYPSLSRPTFSSYNLVGGSSSTSSLRLQSSPQRQKLSIRPQLSELQFKRYNDERQDVSDETESRGRTPISPSRRDSEMSISTDPGTSSPRNSSSRTSLESTDSGNVITIPTIPTINVIAPSTPVPEARFRPRHRHTRSQSAPPERKRFEIEDANLLSPERAHSIYARIQTPVTAPTKYGGFNRPRPQPRGMNSTPYNSPSLSSSFVSLARGELVKPPPPLHRPTTFWRKTPRSGVTASSYSPSTHLVRRSTFVAAGLTFDKPMCDLTAQSVESRIPHELPTPTAGKPSEVFWEVIV